MYPKYGAFFSKVKHSEKDYEGAIRDFNLSIEIDSLSPFSYNNRGVSYWRSGNIELAENDFNKTISVDSTFPPVYENYAGLLYETLTDYNKAIIYYHKAEIFGISNYALYINLGFCYDMIGDFSAAEKYNTKAITIDSTNVKGYINRASNRANKSDYYNSLNDFNQAFEIDSMNSDILINRAIFVYDKTGEYDLAISDMLKVIKLDSLKGDQSPYGYNNLGYFLYRTGKYNEAIKYVEHSIKLDSLNSYAYRNLALIYLDQNKKSDACLNANKAIHLGYIKLYGNEIIDIQRKACIN